MTRYRKLKIETYVLSHEKGGEATELLTDVLHVGRSNVVTLDDDALGVLLEDGDKLLHVQSLLFLS